MPEKPTLARLREHYHRQLCEELLGFRDRDIPNIADSSQDSSVRLARGILSRLSGTPRSSAVAAQTLGSRFAQITRDFLESSFRDIRHLRPGSWEFSTTVGSQGIARFAQYMHLAELQALLEQRPELRASLGGDYLVTPDIVVFRQPLSDEELNGTGHVVDAHSSVARRTPLRARNDSDAAPILLASISMKWTMRSDRAQNTRTEALNLLRNRKGNTPQVVVVTLEPLPSRIASIAMGTGDIDCTYHAALDELLAAAQADERSHDQLDMLRMLIDGRRLRDISDLPLDLAT
jgi:hypothetical protein